MELVVGPVLMVLAREVAVNLEVTRHVQQVLAQILIQNQLAVPLLVILMELVVGPVLMVLAREVVIAVLAMNLR